MLSSVREFLVPFNNKIKVTAIVTARLQAVFKPSSSHLQGRLQAVFKTVFKPSSRPSGSAYWLRTSLRDILNFRIADFKRVLLLLLLLLFE